MSPLETVVLQLRKWDRKGYLENRPRPHLAEQAAGACSRVGIDTRLGKTCAFEAMGLTIFQEGHPEIVVPFADVSGADWMSKSIEVKVRMKTTPDFDRLLVERFDGGTVVIDGLGQAAFPLLHAFRMIAEQNRKRRAGKA